MFSSVRLCQTKMGFPENFEENLCAMSQNFWEAPCTIDRVLQAFVCHIVVHEGERREESEPVLYHGLQHAALEIQIQPWAGSGSGRGGAAEQAPSPGQPHPGRSRSAQGREPAGAVKALDYPDRVELPSVQHDRRNIPDEDLARPVAAVQPRHLPAGQETADDQLLDTSRDSAEVIDRRDTDLSHLTAAERFSLALNANRISSPEPSVSRSRFESEQTEDVPETEEDVRVEMLPSPVASVEHQYVSSPRRGVREEGTLNFPTQPSESGATELWVSEDGREWTPVSDRQEHGDNTDWSSSDRSSKSPGRLPPNTERKPVSETSGAGSTLEEEGYDRVQESPPLYWTEAYLETARSPRVKIREEEQEDVRSLETSWRAEPRVRSVTPRRPGASGSSVRRSRSFSPGALHDERGDSSAASGTRDRHHNLVERASQTDRPSSPSKPVTEAVQSTRDWTPFHSDYEFSTPKRPQETFGTQTDGNHQVSDQCIGTDSEGAQLDVRDRRPGNAEVQTGRSHEAAHGYSDDADNRSVSVQTADAITVDSFTQSSPRTSTSSSFEDDAFEAQVRAREHVFTDAHIPWSVPEREHTQSSTRTIETQTYPDLRVIETQTSVDRFVLTTETQTREAVEHTSEVQTEILDATTAEMRLPASAQIVKLEMRLSETTSLEDAPDAPDSSTETQGEVTVSCVSLEPQPTHLEDDTFLTGAYLGDSEQPIPPPPPPPPPRDVETADGSGNSLCPEKMKVTAHRATSNSESSSSESLPTVVERTPAKSFVLSLDDAKKTLENAFQGVIAPQELEDSSTSQPERNGSEVKGTSDPAESENSQNSHSRNKQRDTDDTRDRDASKNKDDIFNSSADRSVAESEKNSALINASDYDTPSNDSSSLSTYGVHVDGSSSGESITEETIQMSSKVLPNNLVSAAELILHELKSYPSNIAKATDFTEEPDNVESTEEDAEEPRIRGSVDLYDGDTDEEGELKQRHEEVDSEVRLKQLEHIVKQQIALASMAREGDSGTDSVVSAGDEDEMVASDSGADGSDTDRALLAPLEFSDCELPVPIAHSSPAKKSSSPSDTIRSTTSTPFTPMITLEPLKAAKAPATSVSNEEEKRAEFLVNPNAPTVSELVTKATDPARFSHADVDERLNRLLAGEAAEKDAADGKMPDSSDDDVTAVDSSPEPGVLRKFPTAADVAASILELPVSD